jgi:O-antigen/teichoic acid export membrane protein
VSAAIRNQYSSLGTWWLGERFVSLLVGLVVQITLVRALGVTGFGEISYLLAVVALLTPISQAGAAGLVTRAISENPDAERAIMQAALRWRFFAAVVACILGIAYWLFADGASSSRAILVLLAITQIALVFQVVEFRFQATMTPSGLIPWRVGATVLGSALKITAALTTQDPIWVLASFAADFLLQALAHSLAYYRSTGVWLKPKRSEYWTPWLSARAPWLLISAVAEVIYLKIDIVMLERMAGLNETGLYAAAAKLSEVWYIMPTILMAAWFPLIWSPGVGTDEQKVRLQRVFDLAVLSALAVALGIQVFGELIIAILYGGDFAAAALLLKIHVWAGVFVFMRAVLSKWLIANDALKYSLLTHGAGTLVNVGLNLWLIPRYGAVGAAVGTIISYAAASWITLFLFPRTRPVAIMMTRALLIPMRWRALREHAALLLRSKNDY